jgi:arylsulfatase A-like enzyme
VRARAALVVAMLALVGCGERRAAAPSPSPRQARLPGVSRNILLITIDTLRADHLGVYGYRRNTSPRMDALAREGIVFDQAYTYWPKTRASMIMMFTGRRPSLNGYSKTHPMLLGFNPTIASVLKDAGYRTAAILDNANIAAQLGYAKGFDSYRETWEEAALRTEMDKTRAITEGAITFLRAQDAGRPFFLWLHYVNPHAPYTPPAPFDTAFLDAAARGGERLAVVKSYKGGIHEHLATTEERRLGYYVAQYDGEIAAVDQEVGRVLDALAGVGGFANTVVMVTSDHGESLGEHSYYFDHGEDLFDPSLRIPMLIVAPGGVRGRRSDAFASTLDVLPTLLDAVKVSYPPDLSGQSLYPAVSGAELRPRERLYAQNDMNLRATFDRSYKLVATPVGENDRLELFDRKADPGETRNVRQQRLEGFRVQRRELDLYFERMDREWIATRRLVGTAPGERRMTPAACEQLKALGYVQSCGG